VTAKTKETIFFVALGVPTVICLLAFFWILYILSSGIGTLNLTMLTTGALQGGIFEMIMGTIYLLLGAAGVAGPIGVLAAVYLVEYAPSGRIIHN
jgi:phosphate transport system permease protein